MAGEADEGRKFKHKFKVQVQSKEVILRLNLRVNLYFI